MGSATAIVKNMDKNGTNISIEYTKDGYTIVKNIAFLNPIERSVQDLLTELTRFVVKEVGDGTTSAIILCKTVFDALCGDEEINKLPASEVIRLFSEAINTISEAILSKARECTIDDIYHIALISTNNNEDIALTLKNVYEKYGMDVMIDVGISNEVDNIVKEYDGMTLETGFTDMCFVNDKEKNRAYVRSPRIYCFYDPVDTPEMLNMLDAILQNNILKAYQQGSVYDPIPTVIFGKAISPDTSSYFETVVKLMNAYPGQVPLLMVTDIHQDYLYEDIAKMCGAPFIKKYLNPELQQIDIDKGLAPTLETIVDFCGYADLVEADSLKTKIINPAKMFDENGNYSKDYNMLINYLETQVTKLTNEDAGINEISKAKRRLNSLKGCMIDFLVGGITLADRNNLKASVEDAVLNCKSAAANGVGYGANFMALEALHYVDDDEYRANPIYAILDKAYLELFSILYRTDTKGATAIMCKGLSQGPLNITTGEYDGKVLSSIKSDVVILETINKILTLMFTCNQYLIQSPAHNIYVADE